MLEEKNDNLQEADGTLAASSPTPDVVESINHSNAEASEEMSLSETEEIPTQDYELLSLDQLCESFDHLVSQYKAAAIKNEVEALRKVFYQKYNDIVDAKKQVFLTDHPDATAADFEFEIPAKITFDQLLHTYRDNRNKQYKSIQNDLKKNLIERQAIIEELKTLVDQTENFNAALKDLNTLRERWKIAGPIPRDNYNLVWNDFHFHLERFYDQLHLDREARDMEFKLNYEQKLRLIHRAQELAHEENVLKAHSELQLLHRMWKEEIGPVAREHRDQIWNDFNEASKEIYHKLQQRNAQLRAAEEQNAEQKAQIIAAIMQFDPAQITTHAQWQQAVKKVEEFREQFFAIGRVPADQNESIWEQFRTATRSFNSAKNDFYVQLKKVHQNNYKEKLALIEKAKSLNESEDFDTVTPIMKQIQEDWKKIGHVPRKQSDFVWAEFKKACNHYFDRLQASRKDQNEAELQVYENKKAYLSDLRSFEMSGDHKKDLESIKKHIQNWKNIGPVPTTRRHIEVKFNKVLDVLFNQLNVSKKEADLLRFNNRLEQLVENDDMRMLKNEHTFVQRKIDELQSDIFQLENNVQFISSSKSDNPFLKEINNNIERHKEELNLWKEKLQSLRNLSSKN